MTLLASGAAQVIAIICAGVCHGLDDKYWETVFLVLWIFGIMLLFFAVVVAP